MSAETPTFRVENLSVTYGALKALEDVSWAVDAGQILGIIGPNGAGKSTCFNAATNMTRRTGKIFLRGEDITNLPAWDLAPKGIRRTFQQNVFFGELSALDNLTGALLRRHGSSLSTAIFNPFEERRRRVQAESEARALLVRFGVPEEFHGLRPASIPYGIQRMLSIALAHAGDAKVMLIDEPGAGLGGHDMTRLRDTLMALSEEGLALVVIEHHMDLIMTIADCIVVLDRGGVLSVGTPKEVREDARVLEAYLGRAA